MDISPEDLERAEFDTTAGGLDPDAVRDLLRKAAERIRVLERDGVKSVSTSVSAVLEQAVKSGEELVAAATKDADAVRTAAEHDAGRITKDADAARTAAEDDAERIANDAAAVAAKAIAEGEKASAELVEAADQQVEEILATAEKNARERSVRVINEAQQRLDRLLAAERDVHDRLESALTDIQASVSRVGVSQSAELALTVEDPNSDVPWADDAAEAIAAQRQSA